MDVIMGGECTPTLLSSPPSHRHRLPFIHNTDTTSSSSSSSSAPTTHVMPAELIKSPSSVASPASDVVDPASKQRPPPRPNRSNFDLEPNPFEQSFARPSNDSSVRTQRNSPTSIADSNDVLPQSRPGSADKSSVTATTTPPDNHKTILPPIASIASPNDAHYSWAFSSSSFSNSLRSGPLSPAMLTGPQQQSEQPLAAFDPAAFRTGLTPRVGLTPGTGLTPLLGGPVSFPPASPNTAAFLSSVMNTNGTPSLSGVAGTITPNTLSAITGVLAAQHQAHNHAQSPLSMSAVTAGYPSRSDTGPSNGTNAAPALNTNASFVATSANNAAQTATNGLFLLSQAHQELTKREEEAAAALSGTAVATSKNTNGTAKRGTKRKSYDVESPVIAAPLPVVIQQPAAANGKRTRSQTTSSNGRRASTASIEMNDMNEEEEEDDDDLMMGPSSTGAGQSQKKGGSKKPETEEEKRRNFLERNRQAALKCRQRKKAWLAQLQAKVEFLQNENETLKQALVSSREEITRLSSLVGSGGNSAQSNGNNHVNGHGHHQQVPTSMQTGHGNVNNLANAAKNVPAMVGGGSGRFGY
ncbi:hypothetical protein BC835DRAFT_1405039 [Cytidiella melzeri]|nr:hypothetical protein BC835DRAFT_1405039 [Cytidiella melzeri]